MTPADWAKWVVELAVNIGLPAAIYSLTVARLGTVGALLAASVPPLLWSLGTLLARRTLDAVSLLVVGGIMLSLLAFIGSGSARLLQLRENLVTGLVGLLFLGSVAVRRPLIYYLAHATARRKSAAAAAELAGLRDRPGFRRTMTIMTLVWGLGLVAQTILACVLVYTLSIPMYLVVSPIFGYGTMAVLAAWTWWYARMAQARGARAAE